MTDGILWYEYCIVLYGMVGMVWYGIVWYGMGWGGMEWDGVGWDWMGVDGVGFRISIEFRSEPRRGRYGEGMGRDQTGSD